MNRTETLQKYTQIFQAASPPEIQAVTRHLALHDLFFLLVFVLGRKDVNRDWLFDRCKEVQKSPDGHLDLWFRDAYKSSIITFAKTIQDILLNPEVTVGIFSCTRPIAKAFLRQIKREFEGNSKLKTLFPEILYANPQKSSPKWSEDDGLIVKRKSNPKEATVEAWGMVDGMPTSRHFSLMVYDDVVTKEYVSTPEMIIKTNTAWELSRNLATVGGKTRYIGTRYHYCLGPETLITMSDWSHKPIVGVKVGDAVVGFSSRPGGRRFLQKSVVTAVGKYCNEPAVRFYLSDGRSVVCTRSHKWWRGAQGSGEEYKTIGLKYHEMSHLRKLLTPAHKDESRGAGYLAGFYDADGTFRKNTYHPSGVVEYTQTDHYGGSFIVYIEGLLKGRNFKFAEYWHSPANEKWHDKCIIALTGGWRERYRFLAEIAPKKCGPIFDSLYGHLETTQVDVLAEEALTSDVYWIETETGNYIADGYCSKNSDTYTLILERKAAIPRIYPATDTGKPDGTPLLWTREVLMEKIKDMGVATAAAQLFQDPRTDSLSGFNIDDLRYWSPEHYTSLNIYILVDPANAKGKRSDYTVFAIMGLGEDENYYVIDILRDRLSLTEKANILFKLHRSFRPLAVGYEQYGLQADIQHYEDRMARENYRFQIIPLGGKVKKEERVSGLQPLTEAHRLYIPDHCIHKDYQGAQVDVTRSAVEEFRLFPFSPHDDILDAISRILDPNFITARPRPSTQSGKLQETTDSAFDPFGDFDA